MKINTVAGLILFLCLAPGSCFAMMPPPGFNSTINITVSSDADGDFVFHYWELEGDDLQEEDQFTLTVPGNTSKSKTSFVNRMKITQDLVEGMNLSINCSAGSLVYGENYVEITFFPFGTTNCVFENTKKKTPVLIVPGLVGTEIKKGDETLWADLGRMFGDVGDEFMDGLQFNNDLSASIDELEIGDVIKKLETALGLVSFDYTDQLISEFEGQGYVEAGDDVAPEDETLFTFPYDWRYGVSGCYPAEQDDSADPCATNSDLLGEKINAILAQTHSDKVDIVAHSMGGLIVKKYVQDQTASGVQSKINKAVFVGVPNTGAPKAIKVLLQGDNFGIPWLSDSEMKKVAVNMPASYDLLPSREYYNQKGSYVKTIYEDIGELIHQEKDLNYEETSSFLINDHGFNSTALAQAESLHSREFDNYDLRTAGIELYSINGCKTGTLGNIVERKYKNFLGQISASYQLQAGFVPLVPGDNTVPLESSTNLPIDQDHKFYLLTADHSKMLSQNGSRQKIVNLISGSSLDTGRDILGNDYVTQDINKCQLEGKAVAVFSPVDILITEQLSNGRIGFENGSIVNTIPGASFEILDEHKFIFLPTDAGQVYAITMTGTGNGTFTIKTQDIGSPSNPQIENFINIPVTQQLTGSITLGKPATETDPAIPTTLTVKQNADSPTETILPSASGLTNDQLGDFTAPVSTAVLSGDKNDDETYKGNVLVAITAEDPNSGVLNTHYKLDSGEYGLYSEPFVVSMEGKRTVYFYSTDKNGNNEPEKTVEFEIKNPPAPAPENPPVVSGGGGGGGSVILVLNNQDNKDDDEEKLQEIQAMIDDLQDKINQYANSKLANTASESKLVENLIQSQENQTDVNIQPTAPDKTAFTAGVLPLAGLPWQAVARVVALMAILVAIALLVWRMYSRIR